jgi:NAD(P)-dependent dehydrogenase (short-subunit alcohol dehydrogenase family)
MRGLEGKRAVVTGAARGIGRATAERLGQEGARVALIDVDGDALAEASASLAGAGLHVVARAADVSDEPAIEAAVGWASSVLEGLDVVVANAAVHLTGRDDRADRLDRAVWQATIDTNLTCAFLTAKHGARALLGRGGAVVSVASAAGLYGIARGLQAYAASKAGMLGLARPMAADFAGEGIRVHAVFPGITATPMNAWWTGDEALRAQVVAPVPRGARRGRTRSRRWWHSLRPTTPRTSPGPSGPSTEG